MNSYWRSVEPRTEVSGTPLQAGELAPAWWHSTLVTRDAKNLEAWVKCASDVRRLFLCPARSRLHNAQRLSQRPIKFWNPGCGVRPPASRRAVLGDEGSRRFTMRDHEGAALVSLLFLGRGKPSTHVRVLARLDAETPEGAGFTGRAESASESCHRRARRRAGESNDAARRTGCVAATRHRRSRAERLACSPPSGKHLRGRGAGRRQDRVQLNAELEGRNIKLSVNDFIIKACALALQQVPDANAVWAGDRILRLKPSDVAVAVAIEGGLFTPVLRDADKKSLSTLSSEMKDLASRARSRKLAPHEYQGGTFAISNLGMMGIENFDAVINPPHASILAVGAGVAKPIVGPSGEIEVATMMSVTLSVDHRVIDGALGASFLAAVKDNLEHPIAMLATDGASRRPIRRSPARRSTGSCSWRARHSRPLRSPVPERRRRSCRPARPEARPSRQRCGCNPPTRMFPRTAAPAPINTPSPIFGCRSPSSFPVPPSVTECSIETLSPTRPSRRSRSNGHDPS